MHVNKKNDPHAAFVCAVKMTLTTIQKLTKTMKNVIAHDIDFCLSIMSRDAFVHRNHLKNKISSYSDEGFTVCEIGLFSE